MKFIHLNMLKKQLFIAFGIVASLMFLPLIALSSLTNLGALASVSVSLFSGPKNNRDEYDYGECTYWVALMRLKIGEPIPNTWGNAITWATRAKADGYVVNHQPTVGSIMQNPYALGGLGHVAFVIAVNPSNNNWTVSEMNRIGWDEVDIRSIDGSLASKYNFIHQLEKSS